MGKDKIEKDEYDELVRGGKDIYFSACVVIGSALGAGFIILVMFLQKLIFN